MAQPMDVPSLGQYSPSDEEVSAEFRHWHIESLLNDGSDLIDRCLASLHRLQALVREREGLVLELDFREKEARLEFQKVYGETSLDDDDANARADFLKFSAPLFRTSVAEANKLYSYETGESQGMAGWTQAGQNKAEKGIDGIRREQLSRIVDVTRARNTARREHAEVVRDKTLRHIGAIRESMVDGGPLDYDRPIALTGERLKRDYEDAFRRGVAAEKGLGLILGIGGAGLRPDRDASIDEAVAHVAKWFRTRTAMVAAYLQRDQGLTVSVSVRSLLSDKEWEEVRKAKTAHRVQFFVPASRFTAHENVRLRGLACILLGKVGQAQWGASLRLPASALYIRGSKPVPTDQQSLPPCPLGRVLGAESSREPERGGQVSLVNASPIGDESKKQGMWELSITAPGRFPGGFKELDDIMIEIDASGVPQ